MTANPAYLSLISSVASTGIAPLAAFGATLSGDNSDALQDAYYSIEGRSGLIHIPPGRWNFNSSIHLAGQVGIVGTTPAASALVARDGAEVIYNGGAVDFSHEFNGPQFTAQSLSFLSAGHHDNKILQVRFDGGIGTTIMTCVLRDLIVGAAELESSFSSGIHLHDVRNASLDNIRLLGDRNAAPITSEKGIEITGESGLVEIQINKYQPHFVKTGLHCHGHIEGLSVADMAGVVMRTGIYFNGGAAARPWIRIINSHLNSCQRGITAHNVAQYNFCNNTLYSHTRDDPSVTDYAGMVVTGDELASDGDGLIAGNKVLGFATDIPKNGIVMGGGSATRNTVIDGNIIKSVATGLWLTPSATGVKARNNQFVDCAASVIDQGQGNNVS